MSDKTSKKHLIGEGSTDGDTTNDILGLFDLIRKPIKPTPTFDVLGLFEEIKPQLNNKPEAILGFTLVLTLQDRIALERIGAAPDFESSLRNILRMQGINIHSDIDYGRFVSNHVRLFWQEMGIDPDSEDEVMNFFKTHKIDHLKNPGPVGKPQAEGALRNLDLLSSSPRPRPTPGPENPFD